MHDVEPQFYTAVIREMIRHENDVTNHRLMWLLICSRFDRQRRRQGLL